MSVVVLLVQGLIDDPIYGSRAVVVFFIPLSFGVPILRVAETSSRRWRVRTVAVAAALILVAGVVFWRPLLSRVNSNLAAVEQSRRELSVYTWPEWPIQDAVRQEADLSGAIAGYERALRIDDENSSANRRLGQIELSLGQYEAALAHLEKAYVATPWDNASRQLLGEAYIATGDVDAGMVLWDSVDNGVRQLDLRRFWYDYVGADPPLGYFRQTNAGQGAG
jgi:tetratricopeptide (TPR) repeat protein